MGNMTRFWKAGLVVLLGLAGCGSAGGGGGAAVISVPSELSAGQSYYLYAPPGWSCPISDASGASIEGNHPTPERITITSSYLASGKVVVRVTSESGSQRELDLPLDADSGCLFQDPEPLRARMSRVGQRYAFTPWLASCTEIQAQGVGAQSMLVESDRGRVMDISGLTRGPRTATELATGTTGTDVWFGLANNTLKVRADVVEACFTAEAELASQPAPTALDLVHTPPARCRVGQDPQHAVCESTVGAWVGTVNADVVELAQVRRTLGPVHFHGDQLVDGAAYASTIVAVAPGAATGDRERLVLGALTASVRGAGSMGGSVRLAPKDDPSVTHVVHIEAGTVSISPLEQGTVNESSTYKVRDDVVPNPAKPAAQARIQEAQRRVSEAQQAVVDAEQTYQSDLQLYETSKTEAVRQCRDAAAQLQDAPSRTLAEGGCDVADAMAGLMEPTRDGISFAEADLLNAQSEVGTAQSEYDATPDTIIEPVMATWPYTRTEYRRTAAVTLTVRLERKDGSTVSNASIPVSYGWTTSEVAPDPAHNVAGETPDRVPMDRPEVLLDELARRAGQAVVVKVRSAIQGAEIEAAQRAFVAAGNPAPKPGYEAVDAMAFKTVGQRLDRLSQRGPAQLVGEQPFDLPTAAETLAAGTCLLVVAVAPPEANVGVMLGTSTGSHEDGRRGATATLELCHEELGGAVPPVRIVTPTPAAVRWGIYRTRGS